MIRRERATEAELARRGRIQPPPGLSPADAAEYAACVADPAHFIHRHCMIQSDRGAGIVPFALFDYQRALLATFTAHRETIILKARQLGITELVAAYAVWTTLRPYQTVVAISQGGLEAGELIRKARTCWQHLPPFLQLPLLNPRLSSTLEFSNGSRILPQPATERAGRSFNAQLLILDEWAFQQFADVIYAAAAPTALSAGNQIIGISTANGIGNLFHRQWLLAQEGRGMHPVFLPWSIRPGRDAAWYDHVTGTLDSAKRAQEYPSLAEDAFLLSGRPRFDQGALSAIASRCREPLRTETLGADGFLRVWAEPEEGRRYVCGADTAEGLAKGDYSAAVILDWADGTEVAEIHGHWPSDLFAAHLARECARYDTALLGVERNNHGHAVLLALERIERYPRLYRHVEYDALRQSAYTKPPGWQTSTKSKPIMIDALATAISELRPYRSRLFVAEARTYAIGDRGDTAASGQQHDDRIIAYAIAEQLRILPQDDGGLDEDAQDFLLHYTGR